MEFNGFYNYDVHIQRPQNNESGEPELKNVGEKFQDNNDIIIHKNIINPRLNQSTDMVQGPPPLLQGKLENPNRMNFNPLIFLEEIISLYLFKRLSDDLGG